MVSSLSIYICIHIYSNIYLRPTMTFEDSSVETIFDIVVGLMHMRELELDARNTEDESALLLLRQRKTCQLYDIPGTKKERSSMRVAIVGKLRKFVIFWIY